MRKASVSMSAAFLLIALGTASANAQSIEVTIDMLDTNDISGKLS